MSDQRPIALSLAVPAGAAMRTVSALLLQPPRARFLYVMAHGAGAGMGHSFLDEISTRLASRQVATLRYQFPYMEAGQKRPDPAATLMSTVRAAVAEGCRRGLPVFAGGKSMGGRMTSQLVAAEPGLGPLAGLIFLGFPLHPAKKPSAERGRHLRAIALPSLFVQGTRDALAPLERMRALVSELGDRATLHVVEGGDHAFAQLKRSGRSAEEVLDEIADAVAAWGQRRLDMAAESRDEASG